MPNQHPGLSFLAIPTGSDPQVQSHHQTPVQLGVDRAYMYQETGGERYSGQIPFDHGEPVNDTTIYPLHVGGPRSFPPGHGVS